MLPPHAVEGVIEGVRPEWRQDNRYYWLPWTCGKLTSTNALFVDILSLLARSASWLLALDRQQVVRLRSALDSTWFASVRSIADPLLAIRSSSSGKSAAIAVGS